MDKLTALLEEHRSLYSGDDCTCAPLAYEGGWDFNAHLAEMLRELLAEVYAEGFSDGYDLAADDIGAWQCILDHCADSGDNVDGYNNPYETVTE